MKHFGSLQARIHIKAKYILSIYIYISNAYMREGMFDKSMRYLIRGSFCVRNQGESRQYKYKGGPRMPFWSRQSKA